MDHGAPGRGTAQSIVPAGNLADGKLFFQEVPIHLQIIWLFVLAIPVACIAWTMTHEEAFREPREYCVKKSQACRKPLARKFFFIFTCEFCLSHYVVMFFLWLTRYKLLFDDWRGYFIGGFALVWVANQYMSLFGRLRLDIRKERVTIKEAEQQVEAREEEKKAA